MTAILQEPTIHPALSPFPKIADYGFVSNCHTGALVGLDGSVDWLCWPRFDSGACFAALLGGAGAETVPKLVGNGVALFGADLHQGRRGVEEHQLGAADERGQVAQVELDRGRCVTAGERQLEAQLGEPVATGDVGEGAVADQRAEGRGERRPQALGAALRRARPGSTRRRPRRDRPRNRHRQNAANNAAGMVVGTTIPRRTSMRVPTRPLAPQRCGCGGISRPRAPAACGQLV